MVLSKLILESALTYAVTDIFYPTLKNVLTSFSPTDIMRIAYAPVQVNKN